MAAAGLITPMPVAGVFADTKDEPETVYAWRDYLTPLLPFPVISVSREHGLMEHVFAQIDSGKRVSNPPPVHQTFGLIATGGLADSRLHERLQSICHPTCGSKVDARPQRTARNSVDWD